MWVRAYPSQDDPIWVNLDQAREVLIRSKDGLGLPRKYVVYAEFSRTRSIELHRLSSLEAAEEWVQRLLTGQEED